MPTDLRHQFGYASTFFSFDPSMILPRRSQDYLCGSFPLYQPYLMTAPESRSLPVKAFVDVPDAPLA